MIRRLFLYQPMTNDEARAATAVAARLGNEMLTISYRPSLAPMRIVLFDAEAQKDDRGRDVLRRVRVRRLDHPEDQAAAALRSAMATGEVVFNVLTGNTQDDGVAWSDTDAVFTVAFPDGVAIAFFSRVAGGVAPGIAYSCMRPTIAHRTSPWFVPGEDVALGLCNAARFLFFKRPPKNIRHCEEVVIALARRLIAEILGGLVLPATLPVLQ